MGQPHPFLGAEDDEFVLMGLPYRAFVLLAADDADDDGGAFLNIRPPRGSVRLLARFHASREGQAYLMVAHLVRRLFSNGVIFINSSSGTSQTIFEEGGFISV
ncbi:hypothetical protein CEXT_793901 [Caerostris extrusa]|uniref:Uncharacterized protein n=1 Tax=Caerostris extrusa TaxID=172846 RepID=A0AAV4QWV3_CAEEX|nr:hypothetical protein CEXT_793901 [Caerostris extrusa]